MAEKKSTGSKSTSSKSASSKSTAAKKTASTSKSNTTAKKSTTGKSSTQANVNRVVKAAKKVDTSKSVVDNTEAIAGVVVATATSAKRAQNKKQRNIFIVLAIVLIIAIVALVVYGYFAGWFDSLLSRRPSNPNNPNNSNIPNIPVNSETYDATVIKEQELSIHFLELGNKYVGDAVYIKAGATDILIDAGSRQSSAETITNYINQYVTDGKLEYVIATHAHQDHIAGFVGTQQATGIFEAFKIDTIIDFALTNQQLTTSSGGKTLYGNYIEKRNQAVANGAKRYSAADCYNNANEASSKYQLSDNIELEVLYNYYYEHKTSDENNYSVCLMINHKIDENNTNHYFFTGDLEKEGEEKLVEHYGNELPQCVLYKAGHHGSKTSSSPALLAKLKPEYVCICTCAGTSEYTDANENQFPTQDFVNNVASYTDNVYVTTMVDNYVETGWSSNGTVKSMNGNIVFSCNDGKITMYFSNNDTKLKDTEWFKNNRVCPESWKDEQ